MKVNKRWLGKTPLSPSSLCLIFKFPFTQDCYFRNHVTGPYALIVSLYFLCLWPQNTSGLATQVWFTLAKNRLEPRLVKIRQLSWMISGWGGLYVFKNRSGLNRCRLEWEAPWNSWLILPNIAVSMSQVTTLEQVIFYSLSYQPTKEIRILTNSTGFPTVNRKCRDLVGLLLQSQT